MLTDDEFDAEILRWRAMSLAEKNELREKLNVERASLPHVEEWCAELFQRSNHQVGERSSSRPIQEWFPGIWSYSLQNSQVLAKTVAGKFGEPGAADAVELALIKSLFTPEMMGWVHTCKHLMKALKDPKVLQNQAAVDVLQDVLTSAQCAVADTDAAWFFPEPYPEATRIEVSRRASEFAKQKNLKPREWVLSEWASRPDQNQGKAAFARQYSPLVKKQFGVIVNPDTIARDWLPKAKKKPTE